MLTETIAKILIVNNRQEALILILGKHLKYPEKSYLPDLPGGIVEPGESEQIAAIREAKEETGIELNGKSVRLAYAETAHYPKENKSISKLLYIAHTDSAPEVTLSWEHSGYKWVSFNELQAIGLRPFFKEAVRYVLKHGLLI